jgi:hypothetical protein
VIWTVDVGRWGRRSLSRRNRAGAWLAILTCPCHGAFVLYLLAGTAFGTALFAYRGWMYAALAVAFVAGLWMMCRPDENACAITGPAPPPRGSSQSVAPPPSTPRG